MTRYTEALEEFNRASHSDALREMQLTRQPYVDPVRPTPRRVVRSLFRWDDFFVSIATAVLIVIVIPLGLLVLSVL